MDRLPNDMIYEIASHLKDNDLVSFSLVNKNTNSILKKTIIKDHDYYKLCVVYEYNKRVFDKYNNDIQNGIKDSYYLKCLICFKRQRFKYPVKYNHFICRKCCRKYSCDYKFNLFKISRCNCVRIRIREDIIKGIDILKGTSILEYIDNHKCNNK